MTEAKRFGISPHLYGEPLTRSLARSYALTADSSVGNAIRLRERELDAAFLSPLEYARHSSDYLIVPEVAVASSGEAGAVILCVRKSIRAIATLAADPAATSEIILAMMILAEEFEAAPSIVPASGSLGTMLERADAALLTGDAALRENVPGRETLDVVEEWYELTGLPYPHGFWCARESELSRDDLAALALARAEGEASLAEIAGEAPHAHQLPALSPADAERYLRAFTYEFTPDAAAGLREFMQYAYYHGTLPDVPDLHFFPVASAGRARGSSPVH